MSARRRPTCDTRHGKRTTPMIVIRLRKFSAVDKHGVHCHTTNQSKEFIVCDLSHQVACPSVSMVAHKLNTREYTHTQGVRRPCSSRHSIRTDFSQYSVPDIIGNRKAILRTQLTDQNSLSTGCNGHSRRTQLPFADGRKPDNRRPFQTIWTDGVSVTLHRCSAPQQQVGRRGAKYPVIISFAAAIA